MCGIAGYLNANRRERADARTVVSQCATMVHRGPDDQGIFTDGPVGLGMRRLSIIDLSAGHQPIANETETVWVVFNGEIYNYRELADGLIARGHDLKTNSDTEVIVHLYEELGEDCVHQLRGMFAFAIWDRTRDRLFIARDRLGVKPLYYFWNGRVFVFGSEMKAVLAHPEVASSLDPQALLYYLRYAFIPDPLTIFRDIRKLPPGHRLSLAGKQLTVTSYWDGAAPHCGQARLSESEAVERLEAHIQEAVRLRLVSDVPLGAFLSGGIDSSLVVACMAREMSRPVKTFSIGFEEEAYNELPYARMVATHLGTDHHEMIVGPQGCELIEKIVTHFDEPFGDASAIPTYHLSRLAADHVTVALSGDGGDELFAGYDKYPVELRRSRFDALPDRARAGLGLAGDLLPAGWPGKRWLRYASLPGRERYIETNSYFGPPGLARLLTQDLKMALTRDARAERLLHDHLDRVGDAPWLAQLLYLDTKTYLPADVMTKVDRMSMAHSLEAREPLLDHVLVEFVAGLPPGMKYRNGVSKYLLKQVAAGLLPAPVVHRKKQGFGVPLEYWFKQGALRETAQDLLFSPRTRERGFIEPSAVAGMMQLYDRGRREMATPIWLLLVLETWCRLYLDRTSSASMERCAAAG
jgi:asparagine synthase (glutamine-hydrolysing)